MLAVREASPTDSHVKDMAVIAKTYVSSDLLDSITYSSSGYELTKEDKLSYFAEDFDMWSAER